MPRRAVTLIVNPNAGGLLDGTVTPEDIAARIMDSGIDVDLLAGHPAELGARVRQALGLPSELVVVAGGDGTINTAAQILAGSGKTLAIVPSGTLNHLARDLGVPSDLDGAVDVLRDGEPIDIDVGEVNGHVFLCSSMIGFASRLAGQRERWRGRLHPWTWIRLLVRIARTLYRDPGIQIHLADPARPPFPARNLTVAVAGYQEAPGKLFSRSRLDTGKFGVYAIRRPTLAGLARIFLAALVGRWRRVPEITAVEACALSVTSGRPRLRVMNDGEVTVLDVPLHYRVRNGDLRVLRPRTASNLLPPGTPGNGPEGT